MRPTILALAAAVTILVGCGSDTAADAPAVTAATVEGEIQEAVAAHPEAAGLHRDEQGRLVVSVTEAGYDSVLEIVQSLGGGSADVRVRVVDVSARQLEEASDLLLASQDRFEEAGLELTAVAVSSEDNRLQIAIDGPPTDATPIIDGLIDVPYDITGPITVEQT